MSNKVVSLEEKREGKEIQKILDEYRKTGDSSLLIDLRINYESEEDEEDP